VGMQNFTLSSSKLSFSYSMSKVQNEIHKEVGAIFKEEVAKYPNCVLRVDKACGGNQRPH
jgi:hypothetical protein